MNLTVTCSEHPKYKGVYPPRSTVRHSAGCEQCWWLYEHKTSAHVEVVMVLGGSMQRQGVRSYPVMKVVRK